MASGIYAIENLKSGRRYVGSACCLKRRAKEHFRYLSRGKHHSSYLQRSYNAHGGENFVFRHILYCAPSDLIMYEQIVMDAFQPEYNVAPVAGSMLGYTHTDETRGKLRAARARNGFSPMKGRAHTAEAKRQISVKKKGVKLGPYSKERINKTAKAVASSMGGLTDTQVLEVRRMIAAGLRYADIAEKIGCTYHKVAGIGRARSSYRWVE